MDFLFEILLQFGIPTLVTLLLLRHFTRQARTEGYHAGYVAGLAEVRVVLDVLKHQMPAAAPSPVAPSLQALTRKLARNSS